MALVVVRSTFGRLGGMSSCLGKQLHPLNVSKAAAATPIQVAGLKAAYGEKYPYNKPWPNWENRKFTLMHEFFDSTSARLNENSKVIIVDGNVAVGKNDFARRLAAGFDLKFIEGVTDADCYTVQGYDLRELNDMLPESAKFYDVEKFLTDPHPEGGRVGRLQLGWLYRKFLAYAKGLHHLLSTGQGFVMVRSPFTDNVFVDACRRMGYVTPNFSSYYHDLRDNSLCELLKPHITIYLDAPVDVIQQRIRERNNPNEVNSQVLSTNYLTTIEQMFKERCLPRLRESGEVVEIDWTEVADEMDMDVIFEELQRLELENMDTDDSRFQDWTKNSEDQWCHYRKYFGSYWQMNNLFAREYPWDCPEIHVNEDDAVKFSDIVLKHPALDAPGKSERLGQRNLWGFF